MTVPAGEAPKRGDLLQTNIGDRRERTWFVLRVRLVNRVVPAYKGQKAIHEFLQKEKYEVWRERWWELEADFRMRLYRSAERRGGQVVWEREPREWEDLRRPLKE